MDRKKTGRSFSEEIASGITFNSEDKNPITDETLAAAGVTDDAADPAGLGKTDQRTADEKTWGEILQKSKDDAMNRYLEPAAKKAIKGYRTYGFFMVMIALLLSPQTTVLDKLGIFTLSMAIFFLVGIADRGITKIVFKIKSSKADGKAVTV